MSEKRYRILFLCTGNSARSILGEYLARKIAPARFDSASAGSQPKPHPHPLALRVLRERYDIAASDARSKHFDELLSEPFDFVITVCDNARESCPVWPNQPVTAHWGMDDPAAVEGSELEQLEAFERTAIDLARRLELLAALPLEKLDRLALESQVRALAER
jgi:arsenate reductase (thioredoxin)